MKTLPPLSLYIHIPWCTQKCPFCDFNSCIKKKEIEEKKYINHLILDLKQDIHLTTNRTINTIFIGGGTPSLFNYKSINFLLQEIKKNVPIVPLAEISIEMNPSTATYQKFLNFQKIGINRFSIGVQTFNKKLLNILQRQDEQISIKEMKNIIISLKLNNINYDIMYGLPYQSIDDALSDLKKIISLKPQHISWYQLTIEPNTIFYVKKLNLPNTNTIWKMWKEGNKLLSKSGYKQYEISSYAQKGYFCQHNLNYWNFGDYIGIGCGAHGKLTQKNGNIIRIIKNKTTFDYTHGKYRNKLYMVPKKHQPLEYFMNILRIFKPTLKKKLAQYTCVTEHHIQPIIQKAITQGYLKETLYTWETTEKGKNFLNDLLELF
ncbi:radical SAM family heme chaperone HemW [Buchnera aphidicola]|uniref:radical SAM family heme chaperone HemW n=1 Tax=Buchnera aphidicola TaxID=9 RepID=UPI0031B8ADD4